MKIFSYYLKALVSIIDLAIDLTNHSQNKKNSLKNKIFETLLLRYLEKITKRLGDQEKSELMRIIHNDENITDKARQIDNFLSNNITTLQAAELALDEFEIIVKELIQTVNQTVNKEARKAFNLRVKEILQAAI